MTVKDESYSEKNTKSIRVTVACNYPLLREGLSKILEQDKRIKVVAKASNLLDLVQTQISFRISNFYLTTKISSQFVV
jgi:hypothetical protein